MNVVSIVGRMAKDPEIKTNNETVIARFSVAVNRDFKNQEGKYDADFLDCTAFGKTAQFIEKYFSKGMRIGLNGRIQTGSYTNKEGQKVYTTTIIAEKVEFVENKSDAPKEAPKAEPKTELDGFVDVAPGEDSELPFN